MKNKKFMFTNVKIILSSTFATKEMIVDLKMYNSVIDQLYFCYLLFKNMRRKHP